MSFELQNLRKRVTDVEYEVAKTYDRITGLQESIANRLKNKEETLKHNWKWEHQYQLGLEQAELQVKIEEAIADKFINEIKFLRLIIQEKKEKLNSQ